MRRKPCSIKQLKNLHLKQFQYRWNTNYTSKPHITAVSSSSSHLLSWWLFLGSFWTTSGESIYRDRRSIPIHTTILWEIWFEMRGGIILNISIRPKMTSVCLMSSWLRLNMEYSANISYLRNLKLAWKRHRSTLKTTVARYVWWNSTRRIKWGRPLAGTNTTKIALTTGARPIFHVPFAGEVLISRGSWG